MSRFDELITEFCPDGVEYRKLGEVGTFTRGTGIQKKDFVESGMPCIHYGQVYTHYGLCASETKSFISPELYKTRKKANTGDLVIATTSENEEDVCKCVAWLGDEPCAVSGDAYIYSHSLDPKYVAYCFGSESFQKQKTRTITGTKVLRVSGDSMAKFEIPVPPIEVQREVVRILDAFTELTAELTAELTCRKQQYTYYRDRLLSRESLEAIDGKPVEMVKLGDVCKTVASGKNKERNKSGLYPVFGSTGEIARCDTAAYEGTRILVARVGANAGKTYLVEGDFNVSDNTLVLDPREGTNIKYLLHVLTNANLNQYAKGGGQPLITAGQLKGISIPVPSLATQRKVADILGRFDALTTSLADGLPAEIEARRQQYEYYRDRLLDLPRKDADAA